MARSDETVAVVTVTYNSAELIPDLVASLNRGLGDVTWHLVVADNESADGSADVVRRIAPHATVIEMGRNAGYAAGINAAVAASPCHTAVLALNPDVRLTPECVPELLLALRRGGTGIAVPRLVDRNAALIESMRREPTILRALADAVMGASRAGRHGRLGEVVTDRSLYEQETVIDWAEGSTQLISAECWNKCGPWDESFFLYSEETEFDLRARDEGFSTRYTPTAHAVHLEGDSSASPKLWALLVVNRVRLFRKRNGTLPAILFWAVTLLRESSRAALGKKTSREAMRALTSPRRLRETPGPAAIR